MCNRVKFLAYAAYALCRAVGCNEFGVLVFKLLKFAKKCVILIVLNLRAVLYIVVITVKLNLFA